MLDMLDMLDILDIIVVGFLLHRVARVLVPLLSFGRIKVEDLYAAGTGFNWLGCLGPCCQPPTSSSPE
ncbi:hypothetical protein D3C78_1912430 [compost metagenome]